MLLGSIFALLSKRKENLLMVSMLFLAFFIFFFPEQQTYRMFAELSPFISYILSIGLFELHQKSQYFLNRIKKPALRYFASILLIVGMLVIIFPPLISPMLEMSRGYGLPPPSGFSSNSIAEYEYEAGFWLKNNLPDTTVIISDYRSMLILNSLGNKIWLAARGMSAEQLAAIHQQSQELFQKIKFNVFQANSSREAYDSIIELPILMHAQDKQYLDYIGIDQNDLSFIIVISSRTINFIEQKDISDVRYAQYVKISPEYLELFDETRYFKLIYMDENDYLYIYELIK